MARGRTIGDSAVPGPSGPLSLKMIHRIIFRALRAPKTCARRILLLDLSGRTGLRTITNNLRLKLEGHKESFRAEENRRRFCFSLRQQLLRRQTQVFCFSFDSKEKRIPSPVNRLRISSRSSQTAATGPRPYRSADNIARRRCADWGRNRWPHPALRPLRRSAAPAGPERGTWG